MGNKRGIKAKKAAIELSVGTIVIVVLAMTMLILGIVLVRYIFTSTTDNVAEINERVKNEIQKLFAEDNLKRLVIYPSDGEVKLKQGLKGSGFAFSVRNMDNSQKTYGYFVEVDYPNIEKNCGISEKAAESWLTVGGSGTIQLAGSSVMDRPTKVGFDIPENAPICQIRYKLSIYEGARNNVYTFANVDVTVTPR